jgi:acetyltransferase-like isoleucine patch superfamily enzyme
VCGDIIGFVTDIVQQLLRKGVEIPAPNQVFIDPRVNPDRIASGAILHPGARLCGERTYVATRAVVGSEGPATLDNAVLGEDAVVASGYVRSAVLLRAAKLGGNAHVREGTLLEEEASTAHAVGLKNTVLLSFVTLGSLINFCDVLMAGGTSRRDHSEVGSGFIHFNFTPWGQHGDKATPSLLGDVVHGVLLDQQRIFIGGSGGMVGPRQVGYGSIVAAGQVLRRDIGAGRLVLDVPQPTDRPAHEPRRDRTERVIAQNAAFIAQLVALQQWYRAVRLARIPPGLEHADIRVVTSEALAVIETCLSDRWRRLADFLDQNGRAAVRPDLQLTTPCPFELEPGADHLVWVQALTSERRDRLRTWLLRIVDEAERRVTAAAAGTRTA